MNRARRTVRLLCGEAASRGLAVLNLDLHGTGDSSGDFADARWDTWLDDLCAGARWLTAQGCTSFSLLGIRAGALLAWELVTSKRLQPRELLLWQPLLTGKSAVTDLLRTRVAAAAATGGRESASALRGQLTAGSLIEAAGYALAPALAAALDTATLDAALPDTLRLLWLETAGAADSPTRQPAADKVDQLKAAGRSVELLRALDPPYWSTTEITVGRAAVTTTLDWLEQRA